MFIFIFLPTHTIRIKSFLHHHGQLCAIIFSSKSLRKLFSMRKTKNKRQPYSQKKNQCYPTTWSWSSIQQPLRLPHSIVSSTLARDTEILHKQSPARSHPHTSETLWRFSLLSIQPLLPARRDASHLDDADDDARRLAT